MQKLTEESVSQEEKERRQAEIESGLKLVHGGTRETGNQRVTEGTGSETRREKRELHHPELARIPSLRTLRCVFAHRCTWHPSEFSLLSLLLSYPPLHACPSVSVDSPPLLFLLLSAVRSSVRSFVRSLESRSPFQTASFSLLTSPLGVNPPISYALHRIPGVGVIFEDIDSADGLGNETSGTSGAIWRSRRVIGGTKAYIGFCGGTGGRNGRPCAICDFTLLLGIRSK